MALTATEEALVRQLLDQQAAILSLAGNEATITSKLGATKVTLSDLVSASVVNDTDLLLIRQGTNDKSVAGSIIKALATPPDASETVKGIVELATTAEVAAGTDTVRAVTSQGVSKSAQAQSHTAFTAAGASPAFTLTPNTPVTAYAANQRFNVTFAANGTTGSNTLNVSGLGAKSIKQYDATGAKVSGVIVTGRSYDLQYDGTDFVILTPGGFNSLVRLNTANGFGSTNTAIRRYSNVVTNQGADVTYTDSATAGASFTVNAAGVYAISMSEQAANTACWAAIALNPATLTVTATGLASNETLAISTSQAGNGYPNFCGWTGYLPAGSVIRPFTYGTAAGGQGNANTFSIARVG